MRAENPATQEPTRLEEIELGRMDAIVDSMRKALPEVLQGDPAIDEALAGLARAAVDALHRYTSLENFMVRSTVGQTVAEKMSRFDLWEERKRREAINYGATSEMEVEEYIEEEKFGLDPYEGPDGSMDQMVRAARDETGFSPERLEIKVPNLGLER